MKSLHKAIAVLDCFSRTEPSLTLGVIAARLDLPGQPVELALSGQLVRKHTR